MAEATNAKKWIERLDRRDLQHLNEVRELRDMIQRDEGLHPIDRVVLGITVSKEELEDINCLVQKIGEFAVGPLIVIEEIGRDRHTKEERIKKAKGGIITGDATADFTSYSLQLSDEDEKKPTSGAVKVPVNPVVSYAYYEPSHHRDNPHRVYVNEDTGAGRKGRVGGEVEVAAYGLNEYDNKTNDPVMDYVHRIVPDRVLIGRAAIYEHPLFNKGLDRLLLAIEEAEPMSVGTAQRQHA